MGLGDSSSSPESLAMLNQCHSVAGLVGQVPSQFIRGCFSQDRWASRAVCDCVRACVHSKTCLPPRRSKGPTCSSGYLCKQETQVTSVQASCPWQWNSMATCIVRLYPTREVHFVLGRLGWDVKVEALRYRPVWGGHLCPEVLGRSVAQWLWSPLLCL